VSTPNGHQPWDLWDPTSNVGIFIPPIIFMELKCKRPDPTAIVSGRHQLVIHTPRVPFKVDYEADRYVFTPLAEPQPPWQVVPGFIVGSYVLEAYTPTGESLVMWDVGGQENYRPGDIISPAVCTMLRP
jgi:hypothetical protein